MAMEGGNKMAKTQAQMRATRKYDSEHYWNPYLAIPKELEEEIRKKAAETGSVSSYIVKLIKSDLNKNDTP